MRLFSPSGQTDAMVNHFVFVQLLENLKLQYIPILPNKSQILILPICTLLNHKNIQIFMRFYHPRIFIYHFCANLAESRGSFLGFGKLEFTWDFVVFDIGIFHAVSSFSFFPYFFFSFQPIYSIAAPAKPIK